MTTTIFHDTFDHDANTDLNGTTPDTVGTSWSEDEKTGIRYMELQSSGRLWPNSNEASDRTCCVCVPAPTNNEYDGIMSYNLKGTAADDAEAILGRRTATNNYYIAVIYGTNASPDVVLGKNVSGTFTDLATANVSPASTDVWTLQIRNAAKKIFEGAVERCSSTDDVITANGEIGIGYGNFRNSTDDMTTAHRLTEFKFTEEEASGALIPIVYHHRQRNF